MSDTIGSIEVESIEELEDGSALLTVSMDADVLKHFAGIGLLKVLIDSLNKDDDQITDVDNNVGC